MRTRGMVIVLAVLLAGAATAALFTYMRRVEKEAGAGGATVSVIVSSQDVPAGADLDQLIGAGVFSTSEFPGDSLVRGAVTDIAQLQGKRAASPILEGEAVTTARLEGGQQVTGGILGIPEGHEAVTVQLEEQRVMGGMLQRADHVTVFGSFNRPGGEATVALVPDVEILGVVRPDPAGSNAGGVLVTMALTAPDVQRLVFAQEHGLVWLSLLPPGERGKKLPPLTLGEVTR